jgi:hypothetical protein
MGRLVSAFLAVLSSEWKRILFVSLALSTVSFLSALAFVVPVEDRGETILEGKLVSESRFERAGVYLARSQLHSVRGTIVLPAEVPEGFGTTLAESRESPEIDYEFENGVLVIEVFNTSFDSARILFAAEMQEVQKVIDVFYPDAGSLLPPGSLFESEPSFAVDADQAETANWLRQWLEKGELDDGRFEAYASPVAISEGLSRVITSVSELGTSESRMAENEILLNPSIAVDSALDFTIRIPRNQSPSVETLRAEFMGLENATALELHPYPPMRVLVLSATGTDVAPFAFSPYVLAPIAGFVLGLGVAFLWIAIRREPVRIP